MAQIMDPNALQLKIARLERAIERGKEAELELVSAKATLQELRTDPEFREKLAAKAQKLAERAAKLAALADSSD